MLDRFCADPLSGGETANPVATDENRAGRLGCWRNYNTIYCINA